MDVQFSASCVSVPGGQFQQVSSLPTNVLAGHGIAPDGDVHRRKRGDQYVNYLSRRERVRNTIKRGGSEWAAVPAYML